MIDLKNAAGSKYVSQLLAGENRSNLFSKLVIQQHYSKIANNFFNTGHCEAHYHTIYI